MPALEERSISELFSDLARQTSELVRQEVALAKVELTENARRAGRNAAFLAVGGAIGYAALLAFLGAAILLLALWMPAWAAALTVAAVAGIIAAILVTKALAALRRIDFVPRQTIETLKEDAEWIKHQVG
ncbi:MAG: phage holin family protein [Bryobacteraceae bacterium]|nr:phage holin family protein [Bryobacteraceae bacterium]